MSKLLINESPLFVLPKLATAIGLNEAIFIQQINFLTSHPNTIVKDGRRWFFKSAAEMQKDMFPFWSHRTLQRIIAECIGEGYVIVKQINSHKGDQRNWYSINGDKIDELTSLWVTDEDPVQNEGGHYDKMTQSTLRQNDVMPTTDCRNVYMSKDNDKDHLKEKIIPKSEQSQEFLNLLVKQIRAKLQQLAISGYIEFEQMNTLASQVLDFAYNRDESKYESAEKATNVAIKLIKTGRWKTKG